MPRTKLPGGPAADRRALRSEHGLRVGNVFHAGDGNLHPLVLYDAASRARTSARRTLADAILAACVDAGGSLTGEHGIGVDKACAMPLDVLRARPRGVRARSAARSTRTGSRTRARCSPRPGSAARCPARTARTRSSGSALPSGSDAARHRRGGGRRCSRAATRRGRAAPRSATDLDDGRPRPRARARGGRPDVHRRGGDPALGPAGRRSRRAGQRLSLDPPGDPTHRRLPRRQALGPALATASATPRDLVLGVTLVLGDGTVASSGGKVVKNVAGYDLGKLVCGSEGRLALIARVSPAPAPAPGGGRHARRRDGATRRGVVAELRRSQLAAERARRPPPRPRRRALRGLGARPSRRRSTRPRHARRRRRSATSAVWDEARERQGAALGRVRFAPGDLAQRARRRSTRRSSARPPGIAYVPQPRSSGVLAGAARSGASTRALAAPARPGGRARVISAS